MDLLFFAPMKPTAIYSKNPDFVQRNVAGECILVPIHRVAPDRNSIFVLNETGAAFWNRIDGTHSVQAISDSFLNEYEVTEDQLTRDLDALLADLLSVQAIEEVAVTDAHAPETSTAS